MEQYVVCGGNPLVGEVEIGGAKNAALAILAASVMTDETVLIENMPDVRDTNILLQAMQSIGVLVKRVDRHTVQINGGQIHDLVIEDDYIKKIRASYYLLGALLGKYRKAEVALPGGCNIGSRPIDQHIKGFKALGADVRIEHGLIITEAETLKGCHLYMDVVSVGATINVMMAAALADGLTIIENAAKEPHVVDLANFLNSMGANIKGAGTDVIRIRGVEKLHRTEYTIIPDQIEAGTFMFAAAATRGDVTVKNVIPKHLESISAKLMEIGCDVEEADDAVRVVASRPLTHTHVKTLPYPGFPTDMQPQITVTLGLSQGTSCMVNSLGLRQKLCLTKKQKRFWKACLLEMYRLFPVWQKIRMKILIMIRISSRDWKSWLLPFRIRNIRPLFWQRVRLPISLRRFGMLMKQYILSCPRLPICRLAMGQARH